MISKREFLFKSLLVLLAFELTFLTIVNAKKSNEVGETDLERMAFSFMSMIESKLRKGGNMNQIEIILMDLLMKEIQRRIHEEKEREANTVYWHLRQG